jgi:hypothetical protein
MTRSLITVYVLASAIVAACASVSDENSSEAVVFARHDWIPKFENRLWGHCTRTKNERCTVLASDPQLYECTYQEYASVGPWPLKRITVRLDDDNWRWVDGDPPTCSFAIEGE